MTFFSLISHSNGFPVTSLRFTEYDTAGVLGKTEI